MRDDDLSIVLKEGKNNKIRNHITNLQSRFQAHSTKAFIGGKT